MLRKILIYFILIVSIFVPLTVSAQRTPTPEPFTVPNPIGATSLQQVINIALQVAFGLAGLVAVIFLIIGGFRYISSQGNPEAVEGAKSTIVNSIIGLVIILASALIINYVFRALNVGGLFQFTISPQAENEFSAPNSGGGNLPEPGEWT